MNNRLDVMVDRPELVVTIGGREYRFGELPIGRMAGLQEFLRATTPHPIDSIRDHLVGLPPAAMEILLDGARQDAKRWPPDIGTRSGQAALLSTERGQIEALHAGLSLHHPEATGDDAARLYRALERESVREARAGLKDTEGTARRIYSVVFGQGDPACEEPLDLPEGSGPDRTDGSIGADSSAPASSGSGCGNGRSHATR